MPSLFESVWGATKQAAHWVGNGLQRVSEMGKSLAETGKDWLSHGRGFLNDTEFWWGKIPGVSTIAQNLKSGIDIGETALNGIDLLSRAGGALGSALSGVT